jgi:hypothetical protein
VDVRVGVCVGVYEDVCAVPPITRSVEDNNEQEVAPVANVPEKECVCGKNVRVDVCA